MRASPAPPPCCCSCDVETERVVHGAAPAALDQTELQDNEGHTRGAGPQCACGRVDQGRSGWSANGPYQDFLKFADFSALSGPEGAEVESERTRNGFVSELSGVHVQSPGEPGIGGERLLSSRGRRAP